MKDDAPEQNSLRDLLIRMSGHMDGLAAEVRGIEHVIGDELGSVRARGSMAITRLQRLDFLRQSLEDLARLTLFLSKNHDGVLEMNLADNLRITATKELVRGKVDKASVLPPKDAIGDVDLF